VAVVVDALSNSVRRVAVTASTGAVTAIAHLLKGFTRCSRLVIHNCIHHAQDAWVWLLLFNVCMCAHVVSAGTAAVNVGGMTLHSFTGIKRPYHAHTWIAAQIIPMMCPLCSYMSLQVRLQ
jgi:hypothetical protein